MKTFILLCAGFMLTVALPETYYHQQEYNYQTSSSYKNNELQHKNEEEGFYSTHGDLEGMAKPKVNYYHQQMEYKNPKLGSNGYFAWDDVNRQRLSNSQKLHNFDSSRYGQNYGDFKVNHRTGFTPISDSMAQVEPQHSQSSYSSSYQSSSGQNTNYNQRQMTHNLDVLSKKLQDRLSSQLTTAMYQRGLTYEQHDSINAEAEFNNLQQELKRNLTRQLQHELLNDYGIQGQRGGFSYSISAGGDYSQTPNYETREINDLTYQVEQKLNQQLRELYNRHHQTSGSHRSSYQNSDVETFPITNSARSTYGSRVLTQTDKAESPIVNPRVPLTDIMNKIQTQIDAILNNEITNILNDDVHGNYETLYNRVANDLKINITQKLDSELLITYGTQEQIGDYSYSISRYPNANYKIEDLVNLKQQIEKNLLEKLRHVLQNHNKDYTRSSGRSYTSYYSNQQTLQLDDIKQNVENELEKYLDRELYNRKQNYLSQRSQPNFNKIIDDIIIDVRSNITMLLSEQNLYKSTDNLNSRYSSERLREQDISYLQRQIEDSLTKKVRDKIKVQQAEYAYQNSYIKQRPTNIEPIYNSYSHQNLDNNKNIDSRYHNSYNRHYTNPTTNDDESQEEDNIYSSTTNTQTVNTQTYGHSRDSGNNFHKQPILPHSEDRTDTFLHGFNKSIKTQENMHGVNYIYNRNPVHTIPENKHTDIGTVHVRNPNKNSFQIIGQTQIQNSSELSEITKLLQKELSGQLQTALHQRQFSNQEGDNQSRLHNLEQELQRNLTEKLNELLKQKYGNQGVKGGYSYSVSTSGTYYPKSNYNQQQLGELVTQMQNNLETQLRNGVENQRSSFSQHSSYSSSNKNYQPSIPYGSNYLQQGIRSYNYDVPDCDDMQSDAPHNPQTDTLQNTNRAQTFFSGNYTHKEQHDYEDFGQQEVTDFGEQEIDTYEQTEANQQELEDFDQIIVGQQEHDDFGQNADLQFGIQKTFNDVQQIILAQNIDDGLSQRSDDGFGTFEFGSQKNTFNAASRRKALNIHMNSENIDKSIESIKPEQQNIQQKLENIENSVTQQSIIVQRKNNLANLVAQHREQLLRNEASQQQMK